MRGAASALLLLFCLVSSRAGELHTAVRAGDLERTKALLDAVASATERDSLGGTALHDAAWKGDLRLVDLLLQHGASVNAEHAETASTPLQYAVITKHSEAAALLLDRGAAVNAKARSGSTALHLAANRGYVQLVELLLARGAAVDAGDESGATALLEAAWKGHTDVAGVLLANGANRNARSSATGATALHEATAKGHAGFVELLLDRGADPELKDKDGASPLDLALHQGHVEVLGLFIGRRVKGSGEAAAKLLKGAVMRGEGRIVSALLERGIDANSGELLHDAALKGHVDIVRLLLERGAKVNARNPSGSTALHDAALAGQAAVVEALVVKGADVNAVTTDTGATALHHAASWGRVEAVKALLKSGADARLANKAGVTPAAAAAANGHSEIVGLLRSTAGNP